MGFVKPKAALIAISALSIISIALLIIIKTNKGLYDEGYFVPNIFLIARLGLSKAFLLDMAGSPGPTYSIIHYFFTGITHFSLMGIRLTNFGMMLLLLVFIYLNARLLKAESPLTTAASFIFLPIVWVICGLALTEIPTMLCAMISLYFLLLCFKQPRSVSSQILLVVAAGLFSSFAILGRSFFLMVLFALIACLVVNYLLTKFDTQSPGTKSPLVINPKQPYTPLLLAIFTLTSICLPIYVFSIWGALAPPKEREIVGAGSVSLVPWHALLSFCYCGFVAIILAPKWFIANKKIVVASLAVSAIFLIMNISRGYFEFAPFLSAAQKALSSNLFSVYQRAIPALVFFLSFHFLLSSVIRLWENRHNPVFLFIGFIALFIAFSAIKIKVQFSSRYVAQVVPYFLLLFIPYDNPGWQKVARISAGAALGFLSLYFYY